jgi:hypothetical protein
MQLSLDLHERRCILTILTFINACICQKEINHFQAFLKFKEKDHPFHRQEFDPDDRHLSRIDFAFRNSLVSFIESSKSLPFRVSTDFHPHSVFNLRLRCILQELTGVTIYWNIIYCNTEQNYIVSRYKVTWRYFLILCVVISFLLPFYKT